MTPMEAGIAMTHAGYMWASSSNLTMCSGRAELTTAVISMNPANSQNGARFKCTPIAGLLISLESWCGKGSALAELDF
jgi:hypothetical protein